jgi:hypothetical protein
VPVLVAIIAAISVPVASLRVVSTMASCCCPQPSDCHCPDEAKHHDDRPAMRTCHRTEVTAVTPELAAFEPPRAADPSAPLRPTTAVVHAISQPHAPPALARPAAPS